MAVVNLKSTALTNADASPVVLSYSYLTKGSVLEAGGVVTKGASDNNNSVYRFARIPSNARIGALMLGNPAITGATVYTAGFYETQKNGGAAVSTPNQLAAGLDLSAARAIPTNVLGVAAADREKRVWELLGLTADPKKEYDVALTGTTAGGGAGAIAAYVNYVV